MHTLSNQPDTLYASIKTTPVPFEFNAQVADVFDNMIQRSIPGYNLLLEITGLITAQYAQPGSNAYDLGCSLGAASLKIRRNLPDNSHLVGVDNSAAMVRRWRQNMARDKGQASIEIRQQNIQDTIIDNASVVVMNFTLQFIADHQRIDLLRRIMAGLRPGGVLLLAEKICFTDAERQALMMQLHHSFKKSQGYSDLEISQKRAALEQVLIPNTETQHRQRLLTAGFSQVERCLQCLNFVTFLGIKS